MGAGFLLFRLKWGNKLKDYNYFYLHIFTFKQESVYYVYTHWSQRNEYWSTPCYSHHWFIAVKVWFYYNNLENYHQFNYIISGENSINFKLSKKFLFVNVLKVYMVYTIIFPQKNVCKLYFISYNLFHQYILIFHIDGFFSISN